MAENPRIEELRRRVQMDSASIAFAALAEEFRRMGRHDEAIETCRAGLQRHPAYLSARVTLGRALIETGDYAAAREELETVLRSAPENLAAIRGLAQIHERLGHSAEMDPQLAAMMHAEAERVALAPPPPPPPPGPPSLAPAVFPPPEPETAATLSEPFAAAPVPEPEPAGPAVDLSAFDFSGIPAPADASPAMVLDVMETGWPATVPDPAPQLAAMATIARLERFLSAIDAVRHA
jgi:tetratricopeptide (TPR) repeat protein